MTKEKKTSNPRRDPTPHEHILLCGQVKGVCPKCHRRLIYQKKKKNYYKGYELAHIYPLNPTLEEAAMLAAEEKLSPDDPNDIKNFIPLCNYCHPEFDKPRTVEEYRELVALKKQLLVVDSTKDLWHEYTVEMEVQDIITALSVTDNINLGTPLNFFPVSIDNKMDGTLSHVTKNKVEYNVNNYFLPIQKMLSNLEKEQNLTSTQISLQIKLFYLALKKQKQTQQTIFENIVNWVDEKTFQASRDACEAFVSFFIQNCEIFDDNTK